MVAKNTKKPSTGFAFRTAESFLNNLNKKQTSAQKVDLSQYSQALEYFIKNLEREQLAKSNQKGRLKS